MKKAVLKNLQYSQENTCLGIFSAVILYANLNIPSFFLGTRATLLFGILLFCDIAFLEVIQGDPKNVALVVNKEGKSENDPEK